MQQFKYEVVHIIDSQKINVNWKLESTRKIYEIFIWLYWVNPRDKTLFGDFGNPEVKPEA